MGMMLHNSLNACEAMTDTVQNHSEGRLLQEVAEYVRNSNKTMIKPRFVLKGMFSIS